MWFTEFDADKIGRISPLGVITEYRRAHARRGALPDHRGPDGTMWFTEYNTARIGRVSTTGRVTEFTLPRPTTAASVSAARPAGTVQVADPAGTIDRHHPGRPGSPGQLPDQAASRSLSREVRGQALDQPS